MTYRGYYYCHNTVASQIPPFTNDECKYVVDLLKSFVVYYAVDVISFAVTTTGYHILLNNETAELPENDVIMRHFMYCGSKQGMLMPADSRIPSILSEMCSLEAFITAFEMQLSTWYKSMIDQENTAPLFETEHHKQILDHQQFETMLNEIELIPVKENLTLNATEYLYSTLGEWTITDERPFHENYHKHVTSVKDY